MITLSNIAGLKLSAARTRLLGEGLWVTLGQVASAVGTLVGVRLCTEFIPPEVFGAVGLLLGMTTLGYSLACAPYLQAAVRFYPEAARDRAVPSLRATISNRLARSSAVLLPAIVVIGVGGSMAGGISLGAVLLLAGLSLIDIWRGLETNLLTAARRQRPFAIWTALEAWLRPLAATASALWFGPTPEAVLGGYLAASGVLLLGGMLVVDREGVVPAEGPLAVDAARHRDIQSYVWPLMPLAIVSWISSLSDRYIIGGCLGLKEVGVYAAVYGLISRPFLMAHSAAEGTLRPLLFNAASCGDKVRLVHIWRRWHAGIWGAGLSMLLVFTFCFGSIARLLLAREYLGGAPLMPLLALGQVFLVASYSIYSLLYACTRTKAILVFRSIAAGASLLTVWLCTVRFGLWGAAAACPACFMMEYSVLSIWVRRQKLLHLEL